MRPLAMQHLSPSLLSNPSETPERLVTTMYLYWTDAKHGVIARGAFVSEALSG